MAPFIPGPRARPREPGTDRPNTCNAPVRQCPTGSNHNGVPVLSPMSSFPRASAFPVMASRAQSRPFVAYTTAALTGLTVRESSAVVHTVITGISRELIAGHPDHLPGVGTFPPRPTVPRLGVHPGTSLLLVVPARKKVAFSAAGSLTGG